MDAIALFRSVRIAEDGFGVAEFDQWAARHSRPSFILTHAFCATTRPDLDEGFSHQHKDETLNPELFFQIHTRPRFDVCISQRVNFV